MHRWPDANWIEIQTLHFWRAVGCQLLKKKGENVRMEKIIYLAMHVILPQTFSAPADTTISAMVYPLCVVIVPQLAQITVIIRRSFPTFAAVLCGGLCGQTQHAEHVLRLLAVQFVVWLALGIVGFVVAVPAWKPAFAIETLNLDVALVMLAA